jgi:hypothetical protein
MDPLSRMILAAAATAGSTGPRPTVVGTGESEGTTNKTSLQISLPAGVQDGDLMVAFLAAGGGSRDVGDWANTGWTWAVEYTTAPNLAVAYRVASSEGASVTFTTTNDCKLSGVVRVFRGATWGVTGTPGTGSSSTVTAPGITVIDNNSILLGHFALKDDNITWTNNTGMTKVEELDEDNYVHSYYIVTSDVDGGATGDKSMGSNKSNSYQAVLVSISPT